MSQEFQTAFSPGKMENGAAPIAGVVLDISPLPGLFQLLAQHAERGNRAGFFTAQLRLEDWVRSHLKSYAAIVRLGRRLAALQPKLRKNAAARYTRASEFFLEKGRRALEAGDLARSNEAVTQAQKLLAEAASLRRIEEDSL